jgi:hypothetical protein
MMNVVRIILLLSCAVPAFAQENIYIRAVYGTYQMQDLKDFQEEMLSDFQNNLIPVKIVSAFPASLQVEAGMDFPTKRYTFGFLANYAVTSGKLHYSDYSGETFAEQNLNRISIGVKGSTPIARYLDLYAKVSGGLSSLNLNFETHINGGSSDAKEEISFKAIGVSVEPGMIYQVPFRNFLFSVSGGYEFNFNGKTKFEELGADTYLVNDNNEPVSIDWSGMRLSVGVAFVLKGNSLE